MIKIYYADTPASGRMEEVLTDTSSSANAPGWTGAVAVEITKTGLSVQTGGIGITRGPVGAKTRGYLRVIVISIQ